MQLTEDLISFIHQSPSPYHVVANLVAMLRKNGFEPLDEGCAYNVKPGGSHYVVRGDSALIAFSIPSCPKAFSIIGAHTDSPSFRIKSNPEIHKDGYVTLNVEGYGGMLLSPWFDRPLSVAGRVFYEDGKGTISQKLVHIDRDLVMIPSLAIHMNREANHGINYNMQKELPPLAGMEGKIPSLKKLIGKETSLKEKQILETDLFLYNRNQGSIWGFNNEFFSSPRIDDQMCSYTAVRSLIQSKTKHTIAMAALFDNEEVGSGTKAGALGDFLTETIDRIAICLGWRGEEPYMVKNRSFMLSADNGHAVHPNYPEVADPTNRPVLGGGVLIKFAANQKYTTDSQSASYFEHLLRARNIPYQHFFNNSNVPGGSTLGNLSVRHYSIPTVDIGVGQLAMHSPYESASVKDLHYLMEAMQSFYEREVDWL